MTQTCLKTYKDYQEIARWRMHVVPWSLVQIAIYLGILNSEDERQTAMSSQKRWCVQKKLNGENSQEKSCLNFPCSSEEETYAPLEVLGL